MSIKTIRKQSQAHYRPYLRSQAYCPIALDLRLTSQTLSQMLILGRRLRPQAQAQAELLGLRLRLRPQTQSKGLDLRAYALGLSLGLSPQALAEVFGLIFMFWIYLQALGLANRLKFYSYGLDLDFILTFQAQFLDLSLRLGLRLGAETYG